MAEPVRNRLLHLSVADGLPALTAAGNSSAPTEPRILVAILRALETQERSIEDRLDKIQLPSPDELALDLLPAVERSILSARNGFERILARYDEREEEDGAEIAGIVFLSLNELRTREGRLANNRMRQALPDQITDCSSILRHLRRTVTALEEAICRAEGMAPALSLQSDLQRALEARGAYAKFRRNLENICALCEPQNGDAGPALLCAATSLARLTGSGVFPRLRLADRIHLQDFQERIDRWHASGSSEPSEARRIWEDLYAFTQLLQAVNQRQELLEHDQALLEEIDGALAQASSLAAADGHIRELAARLAGRNDTLDVLLAEEAPAGALLEALDRLRRRSPGAPERSIPALQGGSSPLPPSRPALTPG
ncbi:MAG TPA: hypothetical protein VLV54_14405 [Thermoanaerobaculia bacterium]|nr:hypothetical protein [Thermoanaerobaculia bacterium]